MMKFLRRVRTYVQYRGISYTAQRAMEKASEHVLRSYDRVWQHMKADEAELARQRQQPLDAGLISIVIPVYNTQPELLDALADSLVAQTYPHWEACLYDGLSTREDTRKALAEVAARDARIIVRRGETNEGISGNTNRAVEMAHGDWLALCDHDDLLTPDAMYRVAETILRDDPEMIYSDEDKITENGVLHTDPHFKPDFCPDNLRSGNYICHLLVMRRNLLAKAGGLRPDFDGSQDHDLALRLSEHTTRISHIPHVLYHWRSVASSVSHQKLMHCVEASARAVEEHMGRIGWPGTARVENGNIRLRYEIKDSPTVRAIVVGEDPHQAAVCKEALLRADWPGITAVVVNGRNRYAEMNRAAQESRENVLLFVDASVSLKGEGAIREMLMYAQRDDVGAVTPRLLHGHRISHGGFAVGMEGLAQCRQEGMHEKGDGWHLLMRTSHNVAAVSAACIMIRRDHFIPFDERYQEGLGAVDWCLRLGQKGLRHVFTPHAEGDCGCQALLLGGKRRHAGDVQLFEAAWPGVQDPCYSPLFSRKKADYSLKTDA